MCLSIRPSGAALACVCFFVCFWGLGFRVQHSGVWVGWLVGRLLLLLLLALWLRVRASPRSFMYRLKLPARTQRTQHPLIKEYTLNHIRDPIII